MSLRRTFNPIAELLINKTSNEPSRAERRLRRRKARPSDVTHKSSNGDVYIGLHGDGRLIRKSFSTDRYNGRFK